MPAPDDELKVFRRMLNPENWPVKPGEYFLLGGEVVWFVPSDDPEESRVCKPLFWRFQ